MTTGTSRPLPWGPLYDACDGDDSDDSVDESYEMVEPSLVLRIGPNGREGFSMTDAFGVELEYQHSRSTAIVLRAHDVCTVSIYSLCGIGIG